MKKVLLIGSILTIAVGISVLSTSTAFAARTIDSATLDGGSSVTVLSGATISATVNVTTDESGDNNNWESTKWRIGSGVFACVNHSDHASAGTYNETFTITAPVSAGTYNAEFIAYKNDSCNSGASVTFTLSSAVMVSTSSSVTKSGSSFAGDVTGVGTVDWSHSDRVISSNDSYATAHLDANGETTLYLKAIGFDFGIPTGATIDGIRVGVEKFEGGFGGGHYRLRDYSVKLVKNGVIGTTNKADTTSNWPSSDSDTYTNYGGSTDTWGDTWIASDINASNFGVVFSVACATCGDHDRTPSIDHIRITVYYTLPPPDTTPPVVTILPSSQTIEATSASGAAASYTVTAIDDVDGILSASCAPLSGSTFSLGDTTVTCNATDSHSNTGTGTSTVTVHDTTPPVIDSHDAVIADATSQAGANVTYTSPNAIDIVDGPFEATCLPASGSAFAFGDTAVNCNATDAHGNAATSTTFTVTVHDITKPVITLLGENPIALYVLDPYVDAGATASDNIDGNVTADIIVTGSVDINHHGTYVLHYNVSDNAGNHADEKIRAVNISDNNAPIFSGMPSNQTIEATSSAGAVATYTNPTANDADDGDVSGSVVCTPSSASTFPIGETSISCTAQDSSGNEANGSFSITVQDTIPPVVTVLPVSQTVEATSAFGAVASYSVTAIDIVDGDISDSATCDYASGSTFPLGDTTVTCSATDSHEKTGTGTATVTVSDTTPPVITPPADQSFEATGVLTSPVLVPATAVDVVDSSPTIDYTPKLFPLGITDVTWTATDDVGNSSSTSSKVTITSPPVQNGSSILLVSEDTLALCSDNNDNDRNGLTDLADPNCAPFIPVVLGTSTSTVEEASTSTVGEVLGTSTECLPPINQYLYFGGKNDPAEVTKLQEFLNSSMGANLTVNGIFDLPTLQAVKDFQLRFRILLLRPWVQYGHPDENTPTGNVFKLTRWLINVLRCPSSGQLMPTLP